MRGVLGIFFSYTAGIANRNHNHYEYTGIIQIDILITSQFFLFIPFNQLMNRKGELQLEEKTPAAKPKR